MMVVVHRSVNATKTEHADNEYGFHSLAYTNNCLNSLWTGSESRCSGKLKIYIYKLMHVSRVSIFCVTEVRSRIVQRVISVAI